jgi:hypothetical protein
MSRNTFGRLISSWAWVPVALLVVAGMLPWLQADEGTEGAGKKENSTKASKEARTIEAELVANGRLQMVLDFERVEMESPYGRLSIPVSQIRTIELATRLSPELHKQIDELIFKLGSVDFGVREEAVKELLAMQEKAYPSVVLATKHADLEVARRAQELVVRIQGMLPPEKLEVREWDVITTPHSKLSGKIIGDVFKVETLQFGPQPLKLSDVRSIRSLLAEAPVEDVKNVEPDPGSLTGVRDQVGKTFAYKVTGRIDSVVWGTGVYTTDSTLATAAVHAGALKDGQTGIVRVTIIAPPPAFAGSTQNGVTSWVYGAYPAAYQVIVPGAMHR